MADVEFHHAGWLITIIENGIRVYKYHWCHCKYNNGNSCGLRIPYPSNRKLLERYKRIGIPNNIYGHQNKGRIVSDKTKEKIRIAAKKRMKDPKEREKISKTQIKNYKNPEQIEKNRAAQIKRYKDPKEIEKMSKGQIKSYKENPIRKENISKGVKKYYKEHPEIILRNVNNMNRSGKSFDTKPELTIYKHLVKLFPNDKIIKQQEIIDYKNNKIYLVDFFVTHIITVIEVYGCFRHCCINCYPFTNDIYKTSKKQHDDILRIKRLKQMGFNVIVIWEHDIINGKYKKILR